MHYERKKGEWKTTIPKRLAEYFLQHKQQPVSIEELAAVIYPDEPYSEAVHNKLYQHLTRVRKLLRSKGEFIADPRKHGGKYVLENDPAGVVKQVNTGGVRTQNGFAVMLGGKRHMEKTERRQLQREVIRQSFTVIRQITDEYLEALMEDRLDKPSPGEDGATPQLTNPTS